MWHQPRQGENVSMDGDQQSRILNDMIWPIQSGKINCREQGHRNPVEQPTQGGRDAQDVNPADFQHDGDSDRCGSVQGMETWVDKGCV